jgi:uncharacterized protein (UPF0548 family)
MSRNPAGVRIRRELDSLARREVNFDPGRLQELWRSDPWHVDDYCTELPSERRGPPIDDGSFETARRLMRHYEFANPRVVRAFYEAGAPLERRNMLLQIRFAGLRFLVGVRIEVVFDETREIDGRRVRVWGWAYRTLEGHLERGQMDYQVWKWLDTGRVEFRIHAVSEIADIPNPLVRFGFRLLGRREQVRFARECGSRMVRLTQASLASGGDAEPRRPRIVDGVVVSPAAR